MLTSVSKVLHRTHIKWRVNYEMEGWMITGILENSSSGVMTTTITAEMNEYQNQKT